MKRGPYTNVRRADDGRMNHGMHGHPLYRTWKGLRQRCNNPKNQWWPDYGGRGIGVSPRWNNFKVFVEDMGPRLIGTTLERRNNDGPYDPSNCYWATRKEQASNRRSNHFVNVEGERLTLTEAARRRGIDHTTLRRLIAKGCQ